MSAALRLLTSASVSRLTKPLDPVGRAHGLVVPRRSFSTRTSPAVAVMGKQQSNQTTTLDPEKVRAMDHISLAEVDVPAPGRGRCSSR